MIKTKFLALSASAILMAGSVLAGPNADAVRGHLQKLGYQNIESAETGEGLQIRGKMGDVTAIVLLDSETEEVIAHGKYRAGERIGDAMVPDKAHKDDGIKYGDQTKDRVAGQGDGARNHMDDGVGGGAHTHDKSQTGKD